MSWKEPHLKVTSSSSNRNFGDYVVISESQWVFIGLHFTSIHSLPIYPKVNLQQRELLRRDHWVDVSGQVPGNRASSEEHTSCTDNSFSSPISRLGCLPPNLNWKHKLECTPRQTRGYKSGQLPSWSGQAAAASICVASHVFSKMVEVLKTLIGTPATCEGKVDFLERFKSQELDIEVHLLTLWVNISGAAEGTLWTSLVGEFPTQYPFLWASFTVMTFSPSGVKNTTVVILNPASMGTFWKRSYKL